MYRSVVRYGIVFFFASFALSWGLVGPLVGQEADVSPLDPLVDELIRPRIRYEDYVRVSDELALKAAEAVPPLAKRLDSAGIIGQLRILGTLTRIGPDSEPALPQLLLLLRDQDPFIRAAAAKCLGALGDAGQEALPDLFASLDDPDEITVGRAARAIVAVQPDYVEAELTDLLKHTGTNPYDVKLLPLRSWYQVAHRDAGDADLATDLRHWWLVVRFTARDGVPIEVALNLPPLGAG